MRYHGVLMLAIVLSPAASAGAATTLHFTFGLTRETDGCWQEGSRLKYRVAGRTYEVARAEVVRIEGECSAQLPPPGATPPPAPGASEPTDAMLAAGHVTLPAAASTPSTPPGFVGCRTRRLAVVRLRRVIDGDTIEVLMPGGAVETTRYIGINAPELYRPEGAEETGGRAAKALNEALLQGKRVELVFDAQQRDRYGRLLAYVYASGENLNAVLLERGYAVAAPFPPNGCFADRFRSLERQAQEGRRGLWGERGQEAAPIAARDPDVLAGPPR
jgi:micrococcal nuclease